MSEIHNEPLHYYATHGPITDPGEYAWCFDDLPTDIARLCRVVQGITIHYEVGQILGVEVTAERMEERELRHVTKMLDRILELDDRPLTVARPPEKRLMINCRDSSTLFCAMLRSHGIPARARRGFVNFFRGPSATPEYWGDHWACEYWNAGEGRWVLVDAEIDENERRIYEITIDSLDVPHHEFLFPGDVWHRCRRGKTDPEFFGDPEAHGMWFIRSSLVSDLAALNKMELLCWDSWALAERDPTRMITHEEVKLLDYVAHVTCQGAGQFAEVRSVYETNESLRVPQIIISHTGKGLRIVNISLTS